MLRQVSLGLTALFLAAALGTGAQADGSDPTAVAATWLASNAECLVHVTLTQNGKPYAGQLNMWPVDYAASYIKMGLLRSKLHTQTDSPGATMLVPLYTPTEAGKAHVFPGDPTNTPSTELRPCFAVVNDLKSTGQSQEDGAPNFTSFSYTGTLAPAPWVNNFNKPIIAKLWSHMFGYPVNIIPEELSSTPPMSGPVSFRLVMEHLPNGDWRVVKLRR